MSDHVIRKRIEMTTLRVMIVWAAVLCVGVSPCEARKRKYSRDYSEGAGYGPKGKMVGEGDTTQCGGKVHGRQRRGVEGAKVTLYRIGVDRDGGSRTILSRQSTVTGEDGDYQFAPEVQAQSDQKYEMVLIVAEKDGCKREWGTLDLREEFVLDFSMREGPGHKKGKDVGLTAAELIERIGESEREIRDVEAHFSNSVVNEADMEMDWGYKQDGRKEYWYMVADKPFVTGPRVPKNQLRKKWAFDGTNTYTFMYCEELERKKGYVESTLYGQGNFGGLYVTVAHFLGWQLFSGDRRLLSEYLRDAEKVTLGEKLEEVERNWCAAIEVVGIARVYRTEEGDRTYYNNFRFWVDVGRGYRPLRIEAYEGGERRDPWGELIGVFSGMRLRKIDDVWFPVRGSYNRYYTKYVLPAESMGLDEWEKMPRKEQRKVGTLLQWPEYTKPNPFGNGRRFMRVRVPSVKINKGIAEEKFRVVFPAGTIVRDSLREHKRLKYMAGGFDDPAFVAKTEAEKIMKQLREGDVEIDAELRGDFIEALRDFSVEGEPGKWIAAIRALTIIGKPAVADLMEELRRTRNAVTQSAIAIALRVIGDVSAVPALIDALEEAQFMSHGHFQGEADCNLHEFYMQHDLGQEELRLFFYRPVIEITQSLEKLTGHCEGHEHCGLFIICSEDLRSDKSIRLRREARKEASARWRKWWQENRAKYAPDGGDSKGM
jgi:hypothetical protein